MTKTNTTTKVKGDAGEEKICFSIMPISNHDDYDVGHFDRVYDYIIEPACADAGFVADRADKSSATNLIHVGILDKIVSAPMAICDLSSRNPNVFFEFGIRQAFNLPVVVIKDDKTPRVFDTSVLRTLDYDKSLRVDEVKKARKSLCEWLLETEKACQSGKGGNSILELMSLKQAAKLPDSSLDADHAQMALMSSKIEDIYKVLQEMSALRGASISVKNSQSSVNEVVREKFRPSWIDDLASRAKRESLVGELSIVDAEIEDLNREIDANPSDENSDNRLSSLRALQARRFEMLHSLQKLIEA